MIVADYVTWRMTEKETSQGDPRQADAGCSTSEEQTYLEHCKNILLDTSFTVTTTVFKFFDRLSVSFDVTVRKDSE